MVCCGEDGAGAYGLSAFLLLNSIALSGEAFNAVSIIDSAIVGIQDLRWR